MKKLICFGVAIIIMLTSCADEISGATGSVEVYFPSNSSTAGAVEAVTVKTSANDDRWLLTHTIMETLISGTDDHAPLYTAGVSLVEVSGRGGDGIAITLSDEYHGMDETTRAVANSCAALSIFNIGNVAAVIINGDEIIFEDDIITGSLNPESYEWELVLYFTDGGEGYVVEERRTVLLRERETPDRYTVEELLDGPTTAGLKSTLPDGTKLLSIERDDYVCYVNFSSEFLLLRDAPLKDEIRALYAVTNTLCGIRGIYFVHYSVDGEPLYGGAVMSAAQSATGAYPRNAEEYTIYLPSLRADGLEQFTARVDTFDGYYDLPRRLVEYVCGGIDGGGFLSPLPRGIGIESVTVSGSKCTVDFLTDLGQNIEYDSAITRALVMTLNDNIPSITRVEVRVDGVETDAATHDSRYLHPHYR